MTHRQRADAEAERVRSVWRGYLTGDDDGYEGMLSHVRTLFGHLPSDPRCKICRAPFRGIGSVLARPLGFRVSASSMNPNLCDRCERFVKKHEVGVEVTLTLVFADVRGSTPLAERLGPSAFHRLIDRFYRTATDILIEEDALIESLIGDQVAALFVPGIAGPQYARRGVRAAQRLLEATGHGSSEGPWVELGAGVHTGTAYVGSVGSERSMSIVTVLGEAANTTARLASAAGVGEVLVSEATRAATGLDLRNCEARSLELKGVGQPVDVRVLRPDQLLGTAG
jgi:adenylate cyclase